MPRYDFNLVRNDYVHLLQNDLAAAINQPQLLENSDFLVECLVNLNRNNLPANLNPVGTNLLTFIMNMNIAHAVPANDPNRAAGERGNLRRLIQLFHPDTVELNNPRINRRLDAAHANGVFLYLYYLLNGDDQDNNIFDADFVRHFDIIKDIIRFISQNGEAACLSAEGRQADADAQANAAGGAAPQAQGRARDDDEDALGLQPPRRRARANENAQPQQAEEPIIERLLRELNAAADKNAVLFNNMHHISGLSHAEQSRIGEYANEGTDANVINNFSPSIKQTIVHKMMNSRVARNSF